MNLPERLLDQKWPVNWQCFPPTSYNYRQPSCTEERKKTLAALRPIHCSGEMQKVNQKPVIDSLWTTLIGTATKKELVNYISKSEVCNSKVLPSIVQSKIKEYEKSEQNKI